MIINLVLFFIPKRQEIYRLYLIKKRKKLAYMRLNSNVKYGNIKYIDCGGYGTLATFSIGKLLYCKFNGVDKVSEVKQQNIAQLPSEYTLNSSIGVYMSALVRDQNTGSLQISTDGKITLYCPYPYL